MPGSREEDFKTKMHSNYMTLIDLNALAQEPLPLLVIKCTICANPSLVIITIPSVWLIYVWG